MTATTYKNMDHKTRIRLAKALLAATGAGAFPGPAQNPLTAAIEFLDFTNDTEVEIDRAIRDIIEENQEEVSAR